MKSLRSMLIVAASATLALSASAATKSSSCVSGSGNARVVWTAPAGEAVRTVRAYFHSDATSAEHFVELRRGAGSVYFGVLPRVSGSVQSIDYRIASAGANGRFATRSTGRVNVTASCNAEAIDNSDTQLAKAIIVGATAEGPSVPAGFRCEGIIGRVTASGELQSYSACSELSAAAASNAQSPDLQTASATAAAIDGKATVTVASKLPPAVADSDGVTASAVRRNRRPRQNPEPNKPRTTNNRP
jgi:hypothetical protein